MVGDSGLTTVDWSWAVDHVLDQSQLSVSAAVSELAKELGSGDIILLHDAGGGSDPQRNRAIRVLAELLPRLRGAGFELTTVSDLLSQSTAEVRADPRPWFWQSGFSCPA
jgi:peptidoglycan/xylan/chitin deacetylase (PgdA/CDA1 family)